MVSLKSPQLWFLLGNALQQEPCPWLSVNQLCFPFCAHLNEKNSSKCSKYISYSSYKQNYSLEDEAILTAGGRWYTHLESVLVTCYRNTRRLTTDEHDWKLRKEGQRHRSQNSLEKKRWRKACPWIQGREWRKKMKTQTQQSSSFTPVP